MPVTCLAVGTLRRTAARLRCTCAPTRVSVPTPVTCLAVGILQRRAARSLYTCASTRASALTPATCLAVDTLRLLAAKSHCTCASTRASAPMPATCLAVDILRRSAVRSRGTCESTRASAPKLAMLLAVALLRLQGRDSPLISTASTLFTGQKCISWGRAPLSNTLVPAACPVIAEIHRAARIYPAVAPHAFLTPSPLKARARRPQSHAYSLQQQKREPCITAAAPLQWLPARAHWRLRAPAAPPLRRPRA